MFNLREIEMRMEIRSQGFSLSEGLRDYVRKRLAYGLSYGDESISWIRVQLSDINGPRGGVDKRCQIEVQLKGRPAVVIEDVEADLYAAIDRASERAGRTVARRLSKQREFVRSVWEPLSEDADGGVTVGVASQSA